MRGKNGDHPLPGLSVLKNPFIQITVAESTRKRGGQTDHSTENGDNHPHFSRFYLFFASFSAQYVIIILK